MEKCKKCREYEEDCECISDALISGVVSAGVGYALNSTFIGGIVGGSLVGGLVGDILADDEGFGLEDLF